MQINFIAFLEVQGLDKGAGSRTAKLFPHFETRMANSYDIHPSNVYHRPLLDKEADGLARPDLQPFHASAPCVAKPCDCVRGLFTKLTMAR